MHNILGRTLDFPLWKVGVKGNFTCILKGRESQSQQKQQLPPLNTYCVQDTLHYHLLSPLWQSHKVGITVTVCMRKWRLRVTCPGSHCQSQGSYTAGLSSKPISPWVHVAVSNKCLPTTSTPAAIHICRLWWKAISQKTKLESSCFLVRIYPTIWFLIGPGLIKIFMVCHPHCNIRDMTYARAQVRRGYPVLSDSNMTQPRGLLTTLRSGLNEARAGCHKKVKVKSRWAMGVFRRKHHWNQ